MSETSRKVVTEIMSIIKLTIQRYGSVLEYSIMCIIHFSNDLFPTDQVKSRNLQEKLMRGQSEGKILGVIK